MYMAMLLLLFWAMEMIEVDSLERVMAGPWRRSLELCSSSFLTLAYTALFQSSVSLLSPWESGAVC